MGQSGIEKWAEIGRVKKKTSLLSPEDRAATNMIGRRVQFVRQPLNAVENRFCSWQDR
jgi:hypothetical protein